MRLLHASSPRLLLAALIALAAACPSPARADTITTWPGPAHASGLSAGGNISVPVARVHGPQPLVNSPAGGLGIGRVANPSPGRPAAGGVSPGRMTAGGVDGAVLAPGGAAQWAAQGVAAALLYLLSRRGRRRRRARW